MNYRCVFEIYPEKVELYEKSDTYTAEAILELTPAAAGSVTRSQLIIYDSALSLGLNVYSLTQSEAESRAQ